MTDLEKLKSKQETPEPTPAETEPLPLEENLEQNYPFLAERKDKLQETVHYDETFLEHMNNCLNEFSSMDQEFQASFNLPTKQKKYREIIKKSLLLHEIGKLVTSEELEQMGIDRSGGHEATGAEIIMSKYDQLNISDVKEAELIAFFVRNYHSLNEIYSGQKQVSEVQEEISRFSEQQRLPSEDILQLMRFIANANNLSTVEATNRTQGTEYTKENVKKMLDMQAEKVLGEIRNIKQAQKEQKETRIAEIEDEDIERIKILQLIIAKIDTQSFRKKISPTESEDLTKEAFEKALEQLLDADIDLPRNERIKLFRQTLEYYSSEQSVAEKPVWHSTSSYSLRKGLEEGFVGGKISGGEDAEKESAGKPLSITHPGYPTAEDFQEMFARLCAKGGEPVAVDSEKLTGDSLPKVFYESFLKQLSKDDKREFIAKKINIDNRIKAVNAEKSKIYDEYESKYGKDEGERLAEQYFTTNEALERFKKIMESAAKISPAGITDDMIAKMISPEAIAAVIANFEQIDYFPPEKKNLIKHEVLPTITDPELKEELGNETDNPFPCIITFELAGKEQQASSVMKGESPTHIPFEDHFFGTFSAKDIKEVRVPLNQIAKTKKWLEQKGLSEVGIVPIEVYEVKRLIEDNIKK